MAMIVATQGDQETLRRARKGEISIHRAYHSLREKLDQPLTPYAKAEMLFSKANDESLLLIRKAVEGLKERVTKGEASLNVIIEELDRISELTCRM